MNNTERMRAWRARRYAEGFHYIRGRLTNAPYQVFTPAPHGTRARYIWRKDPCRCDEYRAAQAAYVRGQRARRRQAAS